MSETQALILESLYFVEPFDKVIEETGLTAQVAADELKLLISRRLVQVMRFDDKAGDYLPSAIYDGDRMSSCHFMATREGLMMLHGVGS